MAPGPELGVSSVAQTYRRGHDRLVAAGCHSPRLDAELLLASVLGVARAQLVLEPERALGPPELARFETLLARRERREPVAYILGRKGFRHVELAIDARVLVPRPETELLVEVGLTLPEGARVADVGTGSGAIALALKHERPDLRVVAVDASAEALAVARANAQRLGLDVQLVHGDLLAPVSGRLDAVLGNLPYVADPDWKALPPDVAGHEPRVALLGGPDGLDVVRRLVPQAVALPVVALEVGEGQANAVRCLLGAAGMSTQVLTDLAGIDRVVVGRRP